MRLLSAKNVLQFDVRIVNLQLLMPRRQPIFTLGRSTVHPVFFDGFETLRNAFFFAISVP